MWPGPSPVHHHPASFDKRGAIHFQICERLCRHHSSEKCVVFSRSNLFRRKAAAGRGCPEMGTIISAARGVNDLFAVSRGLKFQNAEAGENLLAVSRAQIDPDEVTLLRASIVARQGASSSSACLQKI